MMSLKSVIKTAITTITPERVKNILCAERTQIPAHAQLSFSQEGEDRILSALFQGKESGFFVDVGAHHPRRFSNTYLLYLRGWRGINIDATPGSMAPFAVERPEDINLELAISETVGVMTFHVFNEVALNSFDAALAKSRDGRNGMRITGTIDLPTRTLRDVLAEYLPPEQTIDLLDVDVEGHDLEVLRSNDWARFRPRVVLVECRHNLPLECIGEDPVYAFMADRGYELTAKTGRNLILENRN